MNWALAWTGLSDRAGDLTRTFSGGMKRRVNIGVALLHRPEVIYMDEPTAGIDPQSRRNILDSVVTLKNQGMTVLYTTHYMEEAQELCDHIAIMDHGKLIAQGTHEELMVESSMYAEIYCSQLQGDAPGENAPGDGGSEQHEEWRRRCL